MGCCITQKHAGTMRPYTRFALPSIYWRLVMTLMILVSGCAQMQSAIESPQLSAREGGDSPSLSFAGDGYLETAPPLPPKGYLLTSIAEGVYFFTAGTYNTMFVVTREGVILADPIKDKGPLLKNAIAEITALPVKFLIYSHPHADHIGDAHLFAKGAQIIGHIETKKLLERYADPKRPAPNISFGSVYTLDFGGVKVELHYPGEGHGKGNIMIYVPDRKVLMYVDVATPKAVPLKNFSTIDIDSQIWGIQRALKLDFTTYVGGHLHRPGKKEEMQEVLQYYFASRNADKEALKRVAFRDVMAKSKSKDAEKIIGEYYEAVAEECYRILKSEWKQRLMGFEAFARGHCDVWTAYHRTINTP